MRSMQKEFLLMYVVLASSSAIAPAAEPKPVTTFTNSVSLKLAHIPPGSFTTGSPESERGRIANETRSHVVFKKGFLLGVTEVTQKQWREVMGTDPSYFKGDNLPVENITWKDAGEFCRRLSEKEKKRYRLPTVVEWEYACRAGTTTAYSTGNGEDALLKAGWFIKNSGNQSHLVGQKKPNAWGLYDMHGNISEWCANRTDTYTTDSKLVNREIKAERDHRGGSWGLTASDCRSASRHRNNGNFRYFDLGLRVVCEIQ